MKKWTIQYNSIWLDIKYIVWHQQDCQNSFICDSDRTYRPSVNFNEGKTYYWVQIKSISECTKTVVTWWYGKARQWGNAGRLEMMDIRIWFFSLSECCETGKGKHIKWAQPPCDDSPKKKMFRAAWTVVTRFDGIGKKRSRVGNESHAWIDTSIVSVPVLLGGL